MVRLRLWGLLPPLSEKQLLDAASHAAASIAAASPHAAAPPPWAHARVVTWRTSAGGGAQLDIPLPPLPPPPPLAEKTAAARDELQRQRDELVYRHAAGTPAALAPRQPASCSA